MTCVRASANVVIGALAVLAVAATSAAIAFRASSATIDAGFWWDEASFALSADDARKMGVQLSADELTRIRQMSRAEVERAYKDLRMAITDHRHAFWRVSVAGEPITINRNRSTYPFAMAGQSHVFGPLGGFGPPFGHPLRRHCRAVGL